MIFACACQTYGSLAQGAESYLLARWPRLAYACVISLGWSSRAQKIFNTGAALERLDRDGAVRASATTPPVTARAIVDGDLDATLRLLWMVIARYSLSALLDREALVREAEGVVSAAGKWRRAGLSPARPQTLARLGGVTRGFDVEGDSLASECVSLASSPRSPASGRECRAVGGEEHPALAMPDVAALRKNWSEGVRRGGRRGEGREKGNRELLSALLAWCQAVCHGYGVPVRNFTTSFADGRVLCLLLHYYHPSVRGRGGSTSWEGMGTWGVECIAYHGTMGVMHCSLLLLLLMTSGDKMTKMLLPVWVCVTPASSDSSPRGYSEDYYAPV